MNRIYLTNWLEYIETIDQKMEEVREYLKKENLTLTETIEMELRLIEIAGNSRFLLQVVQNITDNADYDEIVRIVQD